MESVDVNLFLFHHALVAAFGQKLLSRLCDLKVLDNACFRGVKTRLYGRSMAVD